MFFGSVGADGKNNGKQPKAYHSIHIVSTNPSNFGERFRFRYGDLDDVITALQLIKNDIESTFPSNEQDEDEEQHTTIPTKHVAKKTKM